MLYLSWISTHKVILFPAVLTVISGVGKVSHCVPICCVIFLHHIATVQSKASCIQSQPHVENGLGTLALKGGCLSRLSWTLLSPAAGRATGIRGDTWNRAKPRWGAMFLPCLWDQKRSILRVRRCSRALHPARETQTSVLPPYLWANAVYLIHRPTLQSAWYIIRKMNE